MKILRLWFNSGWYVEDSIFSVNKLPITSPARSASIYNALFDFYADKNVDLASMFFSYLVYIYRSDDKYILQAIKFHVQLQPFKTELLKLYDDWNLLR